jgi:hypothetical protein
VVKIQCGGRSAKVLRPPLIFRRKIGNPTAPLGNPNHYNKTHFRALYRL